MITVLISFVMTRLITLWLRKLNRVVPVAYLKQKKIQIIWVITESSNHIKEKQKNIVELWHVQILVEFQCYKVRWIWESITHKRL